MPFSQKGNARCTKNSKNDIFCYLLNFSRNKRLLSDIKILIKILKNYVPDGKFRKIKVRVKGQNYRVIHRAGYFAD